MFNLGRREWIILAICLTILVSLLLPAIHAARLSAQRMDTNNRLRGLVLAAMNYESAYKKLPQGAMWHNDEPVLGWPVAIFPFVEASSFYYAVDKSLPYDHPANYYHFFVRPWAFTTPEIRQPYTVDGSALTHFMSNPSVMSLRPNVRYSDLTAGTSNTWLFGLAGGNYQPLGYAYNWRALTWPLEDPNSYGANGMAQFAMASGNVRQLSSQTDRQIVEQMALAPPLTNPNLTTYPNRKFHLGSEQSERSKEYFQSSDRGWGSYVIFAPDRRTPEFAYIVSASESIHSTGLDLADAVKRFPQLSGIELTVFDQNTAKLLTALPNLQTLICPPLNLSAEDISHLKKLSKLKTISASHSSATEEGISPAEVRSLQLLRDELPNTEVHVRQH